MVISRGEASASEVEAAILAGGDFTFVDTSGARGGGLEGVDERELEAEFEDGVSEIEVDEDDDDDDEDDDDDDDNGDDD